MAIINEHDFPPLPSQERKRGLAIERKAANQAPAPNSQGTCTSLNDLPDELILEILEHLPGRAISPLPALARTSRRLYLIVIGQLYECYNNHDCEPYLFLRSLISNARIAEQVRKVRFHNDIPQRVYIPTAKDKKVIKEGLRAIEIPSWKTWATKCNEDLASDEALRSIILLYTSNVTSITHKEELLTVPIPKPEWVNIVKKSAMGAFGRVHRFDNLRSIKIDVSLSFLGNFAPLFRVQSLRKIHLLGVAEYDFTTSTGRLNTDKHARELQRLIPPACNDIEELILDECFYSELCLDVMIRSSRRLKTFKYSAYLLEAWEGCYEWRADNLPRDRSKTIIKILRHHEASLEILHIFASHRVEREMPDQIHLYDNMTTFTSLKEISCPLGMITSAKDDTFANRLPSSLVRFRAPMRAFTQDRMRLDALEHMLDNCATYTPQLHELRAAEAKRNPSNWNKFITLSSTAGIKFVYERYRHSRDWIYLHNSEKWEDFYDSDDLYESDDFIDSDDSSLWT